MKKVSIVIPTYNRAEMLEETLKSCLEQTYSNIEIIVVSDGSIDNTNEMMKEYLDDSKIIYIEKENEGVPKTLNTGFDKSTGDYLTWIADDNLFKNNAIEKMVRVLNNTDEPSFVYCDYDLYMKEENYSRRIMISSEDRLFRGYCVGGCFMYHREILDEIGGYAEDFKYIEDYEYFLRIEKYFNMVHLNENLFVFSIHNETLSKKKAKEISKLLKILRMKYNLTERFLDSFKEYRMDRDIFVWGTGSAAKILTEELSVKNIKIQKFINSNVDANIKEFEGAEIISPTQLENYLKENINNKPYILIASKFKTEIKKKLDLIGLEEKKDYYCQFNDIDCK